jgi:hypothetical protein
MHLFEISSLSASICTQFHYPHFYPSSRPDIKNIDKKIPIPGLRHSGQTNIRSGDKNDYVMGTLYWLSDEEELGGFEKAATIKRKDVHFRRILVYMESGQPVPALHTSMVGVCL